ncbi:TIGR03545 family protein [Gynuella sp.]|uniref:TIGR03545 family protein n=1 Tax=Gynuella sp. TaxID=2969146 RepID=UPI003D11FC2D
MKKIIRWPGLIGFFVLLALFVGGWYLFAGTVARMTVESTGRSLTGLPVTVADASFSIEPLGFHFSGLQLPDAKDFNQDAVYIDKAFAQIQFWKLLRGKVVVSDLSVSGMVFDQPRSKPWQPLKTKTAPDSKQKPGLVTKGRKIVQDKVEAIPTPAEILEQEKQQLITLKKAEQLQTVANQSRKDVETGLKSIPDQQALAEYSRQIKELANTRFKTLEDFQKGRQQFEQLQKSIREDRKKVESSVALVDSSIKNLNSAVAELKAAPGEDLDRLSEKYSLGNFNLRNISEFILGPQILSYLDTAKRWYERAEPFIPKSDEEDTDTKPERLKGRDVIFPSNNPDPSFWLQHARLEALKETHKFDIQLQDFSSQYRAIQRPATMNIAMSDTRDTGVKAMTITGEMIPGEQRYQVDWSGLALKDKKLLDSDDMTLGLQADSVNLDGLVKVVHGVIDLNLSSQFNKATFSTEGKGQVNKQLGRALARIHQFDLVVTGKGKLNDLKTEIDSSLDEQIGSAITAQLKEQQQALTADLKTRLQQQANKALAPVNKQLNKYDVQLTDLNQVSGQLDDLLQQKLEDFAARQKREAEEKAKDAAKKKADKAKQKAADKLKDTFKGF